MTLTVTVKLFKVKFQSCLSSIDFFFVLLQTDRCETSSQGSNMKSEVALTFLRMHSLCNDVKQWYVCCTVMLAAAFIWQCCCFRCTVSWWIIKRIQRVQLSFLGTEPPAESRRIASSYISNPGKTGQNRVLMRNMPRLASDLQTVRSAVLWRRCFLRGGFFCLLTLYWSGVMFCYIIIFHLAAVCKNPAAVNKTPLKWEELHYRRQNVQHPGDRGKAISGRLSVMKSKQKKTQNSPGSICSLRD